MCEESRAQLEYWDISSRQVKAWDDARRHPDDDVAALRYQAATEAMDAFRRDHDGETFRVFRPEDIDAMFRNDVETWDV